MTLFIHDEKKNLSTKNDFIIKVIYNSSFVGSFSTIFFSYENLQNKIRKKKTKEHIFLFEKKNRNCARRVELKIINKNKPSSLFFSFFFCRSNDTHSHVDTRNC